ncbi:unnamed protein product [Paramecium octaurelia]|uniref:Uncharacterized protein n=1 Tax=Paramecium octaurelia TaxID=43137 RepID=A0A8S1SXW0_PAROT|nr:unnamed protein product [Paramecium octaurelia]
MQTQKIVMDPFCYRQFEKYASQQIIYDRDKFIEQVNEQYRVEELRDGYAPFCKHLFLENFTETPNYTLEIKKENEHLIRTAYKARNENELPFLARFIPIESIQLQKAKYLDIILYSKEYFTSRNQQRGLEDINGAIDYDYGIIGIKPQDGTDQTPMPPMTCVRNALGQKFGGSGFELNKEEYLNCVEYWSKHIYAEHLCSPLF